MKRKKLSTKPANLLPLQFLLTILSSLLFFYLCDFFRMTTLHKPNGKECEKEWAAHPSTGGPLRVATESNERERVHLLVIVTFEERRKTTKPLQSVEVEFPLLSRLIPAIDDTNE